MIQSQIGDDGVGNFQIQAPKPRLQQLWEQYKDSKRQARLDKHHYEEEMTITKWVKSPEDSEESD